MQISRRYLLLAPAALAACRRAARPPVVRAADYLWSRQDSDGGWHSHTYGLLRSGQSLTPFVLDALLDLAAPPTSNLDRAINFIREHTQRDGALGLTGDFPDYPNYATALAVKVLCRARPAGWESQVASIAAYLRAQQFTEQNGWRRPDPAYGAWGMGGERRTPPATGHVDLSMTRLVLEALRTAGVSASDPIFEKALVYVERCQNGDGGFHFTTTEYDTNKAGHDGRGFRRYGTATADGILALRATGAPSTDRRVTRAREWLAAHHRGLTVPGFVGEAYQRWPQGLSFYYAAAFTQAMRADAAVIRELERAQRADGSWSNPNNLVKEDDPLIATAFAIRALSTPQASAEPSSLTGGPSTLKAGR